MKDAIKFVAWTVATVLSLLLSACGERPASGYNKFVEAYTSGRISRKGQVSVILSRDIPDKTLRETAPAQIFSITPKAEGHCQFTNGHTLTFVPTAGLERNTTYTVTADIGRLFSEAEGDERTFTFRFTTLPTAFDGGLESFEETADNKYRYTFTIVSADAEDDSRVEKRVRASEGNTQWQHRPDGTRHELTVDIDATERGRTLSIVAADDEGERTLATADVPAKNEMRVFGVACRQDGQKYVEVAFTKRLDAKQNMAGLATIADNESQAVDVFGNTLRLYPDMGRDSATVRLSSAIRSASGVRLGEDVVRRIGLATAKPEVKFTSSGVIVPLSGKVEIPFRSIYMRGVRAKIFKVYASNIGPMLQGGDIDEHGGLTRYGRPVAVKTLFFDEKTADLSKWQTNAIDLSELAETEPGAMYRVELHLVPGLSAWPAAEVEQKDRRQIETEDKQIFSRLCAQFDSGDGWYYMNDDLDWQTYNWRESDDPAKPSYYAGKGAGRNVLSTNIGLTALMGDSKQLNVVALNLLDAKPMSGVTVRAFNFQNQVIAESVTDSDGKALLTADDSAGRPFYVEGIAGCDHSFLRVRRGEGLSTSIFDVGGQESQAGGLKGYIYGERGVWRPGDTLHISFMLQDADATLPSDHPVTLELFSPLGQMTHRQTATAGHMGLYAFNLPTASEAPTGSWRAKVSVGGATFEKRLRIETIKPNRLKIDLDVPAVIRGGGGQALSLRSEWLNGAQVGDLRYSMTATLASTTTRWDNWDGYVFDDPRRPFETDEISIADGQTDAQGNAVVGFSPRVGGDAPGMLRVGIVTQVYEPSGEFSTDTRFALFSPYARYAGIRNAQQDRQPLPTGKTHTMTVASVDGEGRPQQGTRLDVEVFKVSYHWWWSADGDIADFRSDEYAKPVRSLAVVSGGDGKATFDVGFSDDQWGTYLISVRDKASGHSSAVLAYFDWPSASGRSHDGTTNATALKLSTDKEGYQVGDKIGVSFPSALGAKAIVSICRGGKVLKTRLVDCVESSTTVSIEATDAMTPNAYACVSLVQPYERTANDAPIRLYGVTPIAVSSARSHLHPVVSSDDEIAPMRKASIRVSERDGRPMAYTLAIVDEGLLDLTHFPTPDAWSAFYAREAFGVSLWDVYDKVAGAYGGRIESLFSIGGDDALLANAPKAMVNRFTPMVHFAGPYTLRKGERKTHEVQIPNYAGRVRVMVVATDGKAYGSADKSVRVTKPLMAHGTMPRQIGVGDRATVSATVMAAKAVGTVEVSIAARGGVKVLGEAQKSVSFDTEGDKTVNFQIEAGQSAGDATVEIAAACKTDKADYAATLTVRQVSQTLTTTSAGSIPPDKTLDIEAQAASGSPLARVVELSAQRPLNLSSRVAQLVSYPHGCAEQTTSKALAQLYLGDFTQLTVEQQGRVEQNVKAAVTSLCGHAAPDGGIAYWRGGASSSLWCSAYAYIFFCEAESRGYYVPKDVKQGLARHLRATVGRWGSGGKSWTSDAALALYALALDKRADLSTMNRMRENLPALGASAPEAYDLLSAAYSLCGNTTDARELLGKGGGRQLPLRLIAQTEAGVPAAAESAEELRKALVAEQWMSTYDAGRSIMAWARFAKRNATASEIDALVKTDGKSVATARTAKPMWSEEVEPKTAKRLTIENHGGGTLFATVTTTAAAGQTDVAAIDNGLKVKVGRAGTYGGLTLADEETMRAGDTFWTTIVVTNTSGKALENVAVTHIVPAGVEILKIAEERNCSHRDVRDDRIIFYADRLEPGATASVVAAMSATYAGEYFSPATTAEAMYDNAVSGNSASGRMTIAR